VPGFGRTPVGAITRDSVQERVSGLVRDGPAPETVRGHYRLIVAIMKRAAEDGRKAKSPCGVVQLPRVDRVEQKFLDEAEVERLTEATPECYRTPIYTAACFGIAVAGSGGAPAEHDRHAPEPTRHRSRRDHDREVDGRCRAVD
jgi:hypothetical protein